VKRAQEGDHDAFRVLVERYQGRVYRLALRILRNEEEARDAVQDAFLKVYGSLRRFEGRSSFYTWLYRLVFNLCLDLKRKDRSTRHVEWEEERLTEDAVLDEGRPGAIGAGGLPGPGSEYERSELRAMMTQAIETLPDESRETLVLREIDGLSYAEISATLGIPKGTVMSRLHYARKKVQEALIEAGVVPPGRSPRDGRGQGQGEGA
jgi:RNA polymerase sigma-70 factor (ECF subfamily)